MREKLSIRKVDTFTGHKDAVYNLQTALDSEHFYSASGDGMIVKWSIKTPDLGKPIAQVQNSVYAMAYDEINNEIWLGHNYEGIQVINLATKEITGSIKLKKTAIFDIKIHGNLVYCGSGDGVLSIIDKSEKSVVKHIKASEKSLRTISINKQTNEIIAGYSDHIIRIFKLENYELIYQIEEHYNSVFSLKFNDNYSKLYSVGRDAHLRIWDVLEGYSPIKALPAHMYTIHDIAFNTTNTLFATCSLDKSIKIWNAKNDELLKVIDGNQFAAHGTAVNNLLWLSDECLLSASDDRSIAMWEIKRIIA